MGQEVSAWLRTITVRAPVQTPMRHHGRNWPTNINTPGVHAFQRGPRSIFEEQEYFRTDPYGRPLPR